MKREKLDFTDRELNQVALAFSAYINERGLYVTKGKAKVINSAMQKVIDNGMARKNRESILYPLVEFNKEEE